MNKGKDWVVQTHKVHNLLFDCFDTSKQVEPVAKLLLEKWDLKKKNQQHIFCFTVWRFLEYKTN